MLFEQFATLIRNQFSLMAKTGKLFVSSIGSDTLWDLYLNSFAPEDNQPFRDPNSTINNCNRDRHFIKTYGNIVAIGDNNETITMFDCKVGLGFDKGDIDDILIEDSAYYNSVVAMRSALKGAPISSVFAIHYNDLVKQPYERIKKNADTFQLGYKLSTKQYTPEEVAKYGVVTTAKVYTFYHFYVDLPKQYVLTCTESIGTYLSKKNSTHQVFIKGLSIPLETLQVVSELMAQGSLLRSDLYKYKVDEFINIKQEYDNLEGSALSKDNWTWKRFSDIPFASFANELVGTTCIDLAQGKDINVVQKEFNIRVDPANHMKAKAAVTERQKQDAANKIVELGYEDSFKRRFATLEDALNGSINEVSHINISKKKASASNLFANVKTVNSGTLSRHKKAEFDAIETVDIQTFIDSILPNSKSIQVFLENGFGNNLVTLTTAIDPICKNPFKWNDNQFSWTYNGNLAGKSFIKEAVKDKGGNVGGVLRGSLVWNESGTDTSDLDEHCIQPDGGHIYYNSNYRKDHGDKPSSCGGLLDLDNTNPGKKLGIENIFFDSLSKLKKGVYKFYVKQYSARNSQGFKFEIDMNGETYNYEYNNPVRGDIDVAEVTFDGESFTIKHLLTPVASSSKTLWGLDSNQFHKVNLISLSPNYWGENRVGNKHYFFFLEGCHSDSPMRSFHIENLNGDLLAHRKVLEIYGMTDKLEPTTKQLAGLGFTDDSKETLIVKVEGSFKRTVRVKF
jgi:hypothetical protein